VTSHSTHSFNIDPRTPVGIRSPIHQRMLFVICGKTCLTRPQCNMEFSPSQVEHLLATNLTPLNAELPHIHHVLAETAGALSKLDAEILRVKGILNDMYEQRNGLRHRLESHRALLSPARRLPRDVIEEIFLQCIPVSRNPGIVSGEAPLLLGQICSAWRLISITTPRLWSRIHLNTRAYSRTWRRTISTSNYPPIDTVFT